jgi:peptide/nickel transport system substrate-binding protein
VDEPVITMPTTRPLAIAAAALAALTALAGCGGSSSSSGGSTSAGQASPSGAAVRGGTLRAGIADNPDHLDPGLSYTNEGWEVLEATNNGLLTFKKASGGEGAKIVPDIATALPKVSADGTTYTFTVRRGVKFGPPVDRDVRPSDVKATIERLFLIDSGGVGFYSGIKGATAFQRRKTGGISGITADDAKGTVSFTLDRPDGTFLDYMAMPFAFIVPKGTPARDISTVPAWRVATGPYRISGYVPKDHITITRNPAFRSWTPDTPDGNLDAIDVKVGVTPEQAVNETANGQLDWYFESVAPDRLAELRARYPGQVHDFLRNNITYFTLNSRKPPFDNPDVRKAVNYATDRSALVKIFGGQGTPSENILPPSFGAAYARHDFYPLNVAKAKALVQRSGTAGMKVEVWSHNTDPAPKAAEYMAGVLNQIGYRATVKTLDESVYWDTISTQKGDPQVSFNDWNQDFPEGQDFIDVLLNGQNITNVGNNNQSNTNVPQLNARSDAARALPLGPRRDAIWAQQDAAYMRDVAPWVPFMNRQWPKFVSPKLGGLVFNGTYFELLPSMYLNR